MVLQCIKKKRIVQPAQQDRQAAGLQALAPLCFLSFTPDHFIHSSLCLNSVIHQPSSEVFSLFDKLCLLSDGHVVYFGAADRAIDFFAEAGLPVPTHRNPADHFLHAINRDFLESSDVEKVGRHLACAWLVRFNCAKVVQGGKVSQCG